MNYEGLDIDWFFLDKEKRICFAASGGGIVPSNYTNGPDDRLTEYFRQLPILNSDFLLNKKLETIKNISYKSLLNRMSFDFIQMARRGIYSFDKTILNDQFNPKYHLVARPKGELVSLDSVPIDIKNKLLKTVLNENVDQIDSFEVANFIEN